MNVMYVVTAMVILNFVLLVGIAGSLAKMIKHMQGKEASVTEDISVTSETPDGGSLYRMIDGELVQISPTYDENILRGNAEPHLDGITIRPGSQNWDGVPTNR